MQNIILFEGPDGCGKTNISQALSKRLNIPYFKNKSELAFFREEPDYFINALKYVEPWILQFLNQTGQPVIFDRSYPSEWVYSKVFNRSTDYNLLRKIDDAYSHLGTKIVVTHRSNYDNVTDEFNEVVENIKKIDEQYYSFMSWTNCDTLLLNVDDENLEKQIFEILNFIGDFNR